MLVNAEPVVLRVLRVEARTGSGVLRRWLERSLTEFRPTALVAFDAGLRCAGLPDAHDLLSTVARELGLEVAHVPRLLVAEHLGVRATNADIRRALSTRHPLVASRLVGARGRRSEAERYWEPAVLAAGAGAVISDDAQHRP